MTVPHPLPLLVWPLVGPSALAAAVARVDDWPRLIEQAGREGLLGLLAARLTEARPPGVPQEAMAELARRAREGQEMAEAKLADLEARLAAIEARLGMAAGEEPGAAAPEGQDRGESEAPGAQAR